MSQVSRTGQYEASRQSLRPYSFLTCNPLEEAGASNRLEARQNYTAVVATKKGTNILNPQVTCKIIVGKADLEPRKKTLTII